MNIKKIDGPAPGASEGTAFTVGFKLPARPIDANALWKRCSDFYDRHDNICCAYEEIDNAPTLSLNTLRDAIYQDAVAHGLWEETDEFGAEDQTEPDEVKRKADADFCKQYDAVQKLLFEADEALCAVEDRNWENVQEEIADVVIQAFSTAGYLGIDIDAAIRRKMEINKQRPWKHGRTE